MREWNVLIIRILLRWVFARFVKKVYAGTVQKIWTAELRARADVKANYSFKDVEARLTRYWLLRLALSLYWAAILREGQFRRNGLRRPSSFSLEGFYSFSRLCVSIFIEGSIVSKGVRCGAIKSMIRAAILFEKQIECFDKFYPIFDELNAYLSTIDALLEMKGVSARKALRKTSRKNPCLKKLDKFLDQNYIYIPAELHSKAFDLWFRSLALENNPKKEQVSCCIELLFSLRDEIRAYIQR